MLQTFKGYMHHIEKEEKELDDYIETRDRVLDMFTHLMNGYIENLNDITTKVDFPEEYEHGYADACTAIKNTMRTLKNKIKGESNEQS